MGLFRGVVHFDFFCGFVAQHRLLCTRIKTIYSIVNDVKRCVLVD